MTDRPTVLFLCIHNSGRSLAARVLLDHYAQGRIRVESAGSEPGTDLNPSVVAILGERGLDPSQEFPKPLTEETARTADVIVTMGCGDTCPVYPGKRYLDWELEDPADKLVDEVRPIVEEIDRRVRTLLVELFPTAIELPKSHGPVRLLRVARIEFAPKHRQPSGVRLALATIVALAGSLIADAAIVAIGTRVFPSTKGYVHFRFSDYGKLTAVGVLIACVAWPVVTRISTAPRWLFFRLAILVTLVLWLPDLYILHQGQSGQAVGILMLMHLVIALVTYNALVRIAPCGEDEERTTPVQG